MLLVQIGFDEVAIASGGDEADLLAFSLLGDGQPPGAGDGANLLLGEVSQRKDRARKLALREAEEEVRLVLGPVHAAKQPVAAGLLILANASVMARGDALRADLPRAVLMKRSNLISVLQRLQGIGVSPAR